MSEKKVCLNFNTDLLDLYIDLGRVVILQYESSIHEYEMSHHYLGLHL